MKKTPPTGRSTSFLVVGLASLGLIVGIRHFWGGDKCCSTCGAGKKPAQIAAGPGFDNKAATATLAATMPPADAFDPNFEGCKASCGSHSPGLLAVARAQPGAALNDVVFCPVSGAVFRVSEGAVKREVLGKSLYFCCASCAAYFDAHRTEILAARGIASGGA